MVRTPSVYLSPQQIAVLQLSWDGLSIKQVAAQLGLSANTVKNYRKGIYEKWGVHNVEGMLRTGVERGLLKIKPKKEQAA